ncbi:Peroxisomal membrane protein PMP27 [Coemansia sp. RSA 2708]|nr:Peroxisomal membrane protein PMP27 [Coemansia sp. RSA 2708]
MDGAKDVVLAAANSRMVDVYVKYTGMLVGRDKACRLGQYLARLFVYLVTRRITHLGKTPLRQSWLATLLRVQQTLSSARKVMRSGKFIGFLQLAMRAQGDEVERALDVVHKLGMSVFMAADTWGLLGALLIVQPAPRVARIGQRAWMYALLAQLGAALYRLHGLSLRAADLRRVRVHVEKAADVVAGRECVVEEQAIGAQRRTLMRQAVTAALDLSIPVKGLGVLPLNEGLVALAGTVTSLIGIRDVLAKAST